MKSALAALVVLMAMPVQASNSYRTPNGMTITPAGPDSFFVSGVARNTPQSHWCAAAHHSQRFLKARFSQRMYIVGDAVPGQRRYLISLNPAGTSSENGRIKEWGVRIDGANRRVDEGLDFCRGLFIFRGG